MNLWSSTDRFIQERQILFNVSSATVKWYEYSLKAFKPVLEADFEPGPPLKAAISPLPERLPDALRQFPGKQYRFVVALVADNLVRVDVPSFAVVPRCVSELVQARQLAHQEHVEVEARWVRESVSEVFGAGVLERFLLHANAVCGPAHPVCLYVDRNAGNKKVVGSAAVEILLGRWIEFGGGTAKVTELQKYEFNGDSSGVPVMVETGHEREG